MDLSELTAGTLLKYYSRNNYVLIPIRVTVADFWPFFDVYSHYCVVVDPPPQSTHVHTYICTLHSVTAVNHWLQIQKLAGHVVVVNVS